MNEVRMKYWKRELQRTIHEMENLAPQDDLILNYGDFLKARDFVYYQKFNPVVFENLLDLTLQYWNSDKRINRYSLVQTIKKYAHKPGNKINSLSPAVRSKMFEILKKSLFEYQVISENQLDRVRKTCNRILINVALSPDEEHWLCENIGHSDFLLNRVLRYPVKSEIISNWAIHNFYNDNFRGRRAELASWIIDNDPNYEIDLNTLKEDFECLNQSDLKAIQTYDDELYAKLITDIEFEDYLPKKYPMKFINYDGYLPPELVDPSAPVLKLSRRFYKTPIDNSKIYPVPIPNFDELRKEFNANINSIQKVTMIWAIGYSRINNQTKIKLLKKYCSAETYYSLYKVGKKLKLVSLLKWLLSLQ